MNDFDMPKERTYNTTHLLIENADVREIDKNKVREENVIELVHCGNEGMDFTNSTEIPLSPWLACNTEHVTCTVTLYDRKICTLVPGKDILHTEQTCYYISRSAESMRKLITVLVNEKNETNNQNVCLQDKVSNIKNMKWTKRLKFLFTGKLDEK